MSISIEIENIYADDALKLIEQLSSGLAKRYDEDKDEGKGTFKESDVDVPRAANAARSRSRSICCRG